MIYIIATYNNEYSLINKWSVACCSYNIPHTPDKGVYKSENFGIFFSPKVNPLIPVIIFEIMGF